jgi:acyl carrier protein
MALDVVEVVIRCEDAFSVGLEDKQRLESIRTVGELFELICHQLNVPPNSDRLQPVNRSVSPHPIATMDGWTREAVWFELVRICVDQFQVAANEVTYTARFVDDLGAD